MRLFPLTIEKQGVRLGPFADFIPAAVRVGDTIYLSGQVSVGADGQVVGEGDLVAQLQQCYANTKEVLARCEATMHNIVDETIFVTDMKAVMGNVEGLFQARFEAYGEDPEVSQALVEVAALIFPGLLVEVKCTARV